MRLPRSGMEAAGCISAFHPVSCTAMLKTHSARLPDPRINCPCRLQKNSRRRPFATIICSTQPDLRWNVQVSRQLSVIHLPLQFFSSLHSIYLRGIVTAKTGHMKTRLPASVTGMAGWMPVLHAGTSALSHSGISSRSKGAELQLPCMPCLFPHRTPESLWLSGGS